MSNRHHPTWSEIRAKYLSDPEVQAAAEALHHTLEAYAPVPHDRTAEAREAE